MALVIYLYDALTRKYRSPGGPDLTPPDPIGTQGYGQSPYGSAYGQ